MTTRTTTADTGLAARRNAREVVFAWLGCLLLLVNLAASVVQPAPAIAADGTPLSDSIEICTTHGMVRVDQDGHPLGQHPSGPQCECCNPLLDTAIGPASAPLVRPSLRVAVIETPALISVSPVQSRPYHPAQPRAPPLV